MNKYQQLLLLEERITILKDRILFEIWLLNSNKGIESKIKTDINVSKCKDEMNRLKLNFIKLNPMIESGIIRKQNYEIELLETQTEFDELLNELYDNIISKSC